MPEWNEPSATDYRRLEQEQRDLAAGERSVATREIHLEFAEKYRRLAEELETKLTLGAGGQANS